MPQVSRAQTVTLKMQSGFGPTDILSDYGRDYVAKVNEMGGGRLKIDFLNAGAVVKPFSVMDATSTPACSTRTGACRPTGTASTAPPRCSAPARSMAPPPASSWAGSIMAAATSSYRELTQDVLKLKVVGFYAFAMPTQPLGWFKKELKGPDDFKGMKYRTVGLASNVHAGDGRERRAAAWAGNPAGDGKGRHRRVRVQQPDLGQPLRRAGRRQVLSISAPTIRRRKRSKCVFNKAKWDSLAKEQQQILKLAVMASASDNIWQAWDIYSKDLQTLITKHGVHVKRTSEAIFKAQLAAWDKVVDEITADAAKGRSSRRSSIARRNWGKRVGFYVDQQRSRLQVCLRVLLRHT